MIAAIDCGLSRGADDAYVRLEIRSVEDIFGRGRGDGVLLVIETNGGPSVVDIEGNRGPDGGPYGCSIEAACEALDCTYAELREAVVTAYPEAADWKWKCLIPWCDVDVWSYVGRNGAERLTSESLERMLALREYRDTHCMVDCYLDDPRDYEDDDDGLCAAGPRADEIDWTGLDEAIEALESDS